MPRHLYTVAASQVLIDQITNAPTLIGLFEGFATTALPTPSTPFAVVTAWLSDSLSEVPVNARHRVIAPSGEDALVSVLNAARFGPNGIARQFNLIGSLVLKEAGRHWIVTELNAGGKWTETSRIPFDVTKVEQSQLVANAAKRAAEFNKR